MRREALLAAAALAALSSAAFGVNFPELEPNDAKATANPVVLVAPGDTITGNSISAATTGLDYYRVSMPVQPFGIYKNRFTITSNTVGHTGTIRGLGQTALNLGNPAGSSTGPGAASATALDNAQQTSSTTTTPPRYNQWYSFGGQTGSLYYRVTGAAATTADYTATWSQDLVTPTLLPDILAGSVTFTNTGLVSSVDSEIILYDANLVPVPGALNDDFLDGTTVPGGGSTLNSLLTRTLTPGTYFLAISDFNTADSQLSPLDEGTATGTVLDFPGIMANSSTTLRPAFPFRITHGGGNIDFSAAKATQFDINFFQLNVVIPEPTTLSLLALAAPVILRRRRA